MLLVAFFLFPEYASYTLQRCDISPFFPKKKKVIFEQLRAAPSPSQYTRAQPITQYSRAQRCSRARSFFFFFFFFSSSLAHAALTSWHTCGSHPPPATASEISRPCITSLSSGLWMTGACRHAGAARGGEGTRGSGWDRARGAAAGACGRFSMTSPSGEPRPGRAPRRPLIGRPRFVALLLRRCPSLIGGRWR